MHRGLIAAALISTLATSAAQAAELLGVTVAAPIATSVGLSLPFVATSQATALTLGGYKEVIVAAKPDAANFKFTGEVTPAFEDAAVIIADAYAGEGILLTDEQIADVILVFGN